MRIRATLDADRHEFDLSPTENPNGANRFPVNCQMCGEAFYVDQPTFDAVAEAVRKGLDNPFTCPDCEAEYDDLNHA